MKAALTDEQDCEEFRELLRRQRRRSIAMPQSKMTVAERYVYRVEGQQSERKLANAQGDWVEVNYEA